jgi:hypothetical protein
MYCVGLVLVQSIFTLVGVVRNGPIFILVSIVSRKKAKGTVGPSNL